MKSFDYIIAGSGLFGCVFAREMAEHGKTCLIIEKRNHIGGNCFTEYRKGIHIHKYGPHIFHTNNERVWDYVNRFSEFDPYEHRIKAFAKERFYSFPINLLTLSQIWDGNAKRLIAKLNESRKRIKNPKNFEEQALANFGEEIYNLFFKGYTSKQWGLDPSEIPAFIANRIPIRRSFDDRYFDDKYQAMPSHGYTCLFENLIDHPNIEIALNTNFNDNKSYFEKIARKILYTGPLEELFGLSEGLLDYRSLSFDTKYVKKNDYQGISTINFCDKEVKYTRVVEHKHFQKDNGSNGSFITFEYPKKWELGRERFYPINDEKNNALHEKYVSMLSNQYIIGGRLATYRYLNMDQTILLALQKADEEK